MSKQKAVKFTNQIAQGDIFIQRVDRLPKGLKEERREKDGKLIVTHSESGHHHAFSQKADVKLFKDPQNQFRSYLVVGEELLQSLLESEVKLEDLTENDFQKLLDKPMCSQFQACLVHEKSGPDAHASIRFQPGIYRVSRQREFAPEGWRVVMD